eukprot:scaffold434_cov186-Pinguiococcus_pyrenoidosus.AAC.43
MLPSSPPPVIPPQMPGNHMPDGDRRSSNPSARGTSENVSSHHSTASFGKKSTQYGDIDDDVATSQAETRTRSTAKRRSKAGGGQSKGGAGPPRTKEKKKSNKKWWKRSVREKRVICFVLSEIILSTLVAVSLVVQQEQIMQLYEKDAENQLELLDVTYSIKLNQMGFGFRGNSLNSYLDDLLEANATVQQDLEGDTYRNVFNVLENEIRSREIEYSLLVNATGHIVASGNDERQQLVGSTRYGEFFDPGNLVTHVLGKSHIIGYQVKSSAILPKSEVARESPPIWRERRFDYLPGAPYHWADVDFDCIVRFTLTSVHGDSGDFLGIIISGDVLNGKIPVAYNVVNYLDRQAGFAGVFVKDTDDDWQFSSLYRRVFLDDLTDEDAEADITTWSPASNAFLDKAFSKGRGSLAETRTGNFLLAATPVPTGLTQDNATAAIVPLADSQIEAVAVRGIDTAALDFFSHVMLITIISTVAIVVLDFLVLVASFRWLVKPLEKIAYAHKHKQKLNPKDMQVLNMAPLWTFILTAVSIPSVVLMILVLFWTRDALDAAMSSTAEGVVGVSAITFPIKIDQMSFGFAGDATQAAVHEVLRSPNDPDAIAAAEAIMTSEITKRQIEFAMIVDMDGKVVVSPNADRRNETFDPHGIVTATASSRQRQLWTERLTYAEFMAEDPPIWRERVSSTTPLSALSPNDTQATSIVRYTTTLVDADDDGHFDGVLVSGDIVNGKTSIVERNLNIHGNGYEAVYLRDSDGSWVLCTSILQYSDGDSRVVDVPFNDEALLSEAMDAGEAVSKFGELRGDAYVFAALPLAYAISVTEDNERLEVDREVIVVVVYGFPTTDGDVIKEDAMWFSISMILVQLFTSIAGIWIAFEPVRKVLKVMKEYGFFGNQEIELSFWRLMCGPLLDFCKSAKDYVRQRGSVMPETDDVDADEARDGATPMVKKE